MHEEQPIHKDPEKPVNVRGGLERMGPKTREGLQKQRVQLLERIADVDRALLLLQMQEPLIELSGLLNKLF